MIRFNALLAAALVAAPVGAAAPETATEADRLLDKAYDIECPVFDSDLLLTSSPEKVESEGARVEKACLARLAAIKAAHDAAAATETSRHRALKAYLSTITDLGRNDIERLKPASALRYLDDGFATMMGHYDGGKHFHTLIENLPLMFETHRALALVGRSEDSKAALGTAREVIEGAYQTFGKDVPDKGRVRDALSLGYQLERNLGYFWSERSADLAAEGKTAEAKAARAMAAEAFGQWLRISDLNISGSKSAGEERRARSVGAQALHGIARVQFADGDRAGAARSLAAAEGRVCGIVDPLEDDAKLCTRVRTNLAIARGETPGDLSPMGMTGAKEQIAALRAALMADVEANNQKVRKALDGLSAGNK
ncbi:hypothetical protein E2493_15690 [Sphingomonas parva]|uniref:Uncharacterized protein n=1 Tax=Sphingomonas parva TaxID=2555898 RepID=A0A4Y8ZMT1_9SPHN|nr:hypothetical protein [Sphingomonas parva]TFI57308.1 hypothetical protein E2493_15690 [Sphingomonas parva]